MARLHGLFDLPKKFATFRADKEQFRELLIGKERQVIGELHSIHESGILHLCGSHPTKIQHLNSIMINDSLLDAFIAGLTKDTAE